MIPYKIYAGWVSLNKTICNNVVKTRLLSDWNKKMKAKSYLLANKHSGFDINFSFCTNLLCKNCYFIGCSVKI